MFSGKDSVRLEKEIHSLIDAGEKNGLIDTQSGQMIQSILEFRDTIVREVMIPRTEIIATPSDAPIEEIIGLSTCHGHTRIPVYSGTIDNVVGILNVKDLLQFWSKPVAEKDVLSILRDPYYIPETKHTRTLLHELRLRKGHMAIVIDEYGGTSGLVTLEDLIEEIIGEIHDEHDTGEGDIVELQDGYILADGRTEIKKIEHRLGVGFSEGRYETLGGMILYAIGKIPVKGESIVIENIEMSIESADERTIKKVRLRRKADDRNGNAA